MTNAELTKELKEIGLTRKEFAEITGYKYETVLNWSRNTNTVPPIVDSWIQLYKKAKEYDELSSRLIKIPILKTTLS
ncbi:MAG: hypothetical protein LBF71_05645 [Campylobacteraceae bacterium]|jgi:DNA-binding transcriptional regulator YiaG|nr:hypothetical protein [Campylobacteraceae bacterium]